MKIRKIIARAASNWVEPCAVSVETTGASITAERRAPKARGARVGPGAAHAFLLAGFLGAPTECRRCRLGSHNWFFKRSQRRCAYTPLLSVSFPPQRVRLARSRSLRVSSRFFFTVLYNRQSPVLRGPGPESPGSSLSSSFSLFRPLSLLSLLSRF